MCDADLTVAQLHVCEELVCCCCFCKQVHIYMLLLVFYSCTLSLLFRPGYFRKTPTTPVSGTSRQQTEGCFVETLTKRDVTMQTGFFGPKDYWSCSQVVLVDRCSANIVFGLFTFDTLSLHNK